MIMTTKSLDGLTGSSDTDIGQISWNFNPYFITKFMVLMGT